MKSHEPFRSILTALSYVCLIAGTLCLGLGLSVLGYIDKENRQPHPNLGDAVHECITLFIFGGAFCLVGIVLRALGKRPAA